MADGAAQSEQEKESTPLNVDPRLLLGRSDNFTKETENRLCDIERRLAAIETQSAPPIKPWVSLTDEEIKDILDCGRGGLVDIRKAEQLLKEKNT